MPRSLREWLRARDEWRIDNQLKISGIDPPGTNSIIYKRESTNFYWHEKWEDAKNLVPTRLDFTFRNKQIETYLRAAAEYEHEKEQDFLSKFYKGGEAGESEIDMFNNLFQSRELYKEFNERIKTILSDTQFKENKDQSRSKYYRGLAPNLSAVFTTYLEPALNVEIANWWGSFDPSKDIGALADEFNGVLMRAAEAASERMVQIPKEKANLQGYGAEWEPVLRMLQGNNAMQKDMFLSSLRDALGIHNIEALIEEMRTAKSSSQLPITKERVKKNLHLSQKARIGGSVLEPVLAAMAQAVNGAGNTDFAFSALNFGGNMRMTDSMMLFSTDATLDVDGLMASLEQTTAMGNSSQIRQVYQRIQNWYIQQNWDEKLDDLYMVYTNAKNYGIGAGGRDYTKEYKGSLEELPTFLQSNGINVGSVSDFLRFVYNTAEGAINYDNRWAVWRYSVNALKAAAAKIMFDDYSSFGQGGEHAIHMYYLSGKYIPSSYVFNAMADAAKNANDMTTARVSLPDGIKDKGPEWAEIKGQSKTDYDFKNALRQYWDEEYERISATGDWYVSFTLRIKELLAGTY